MRQTFPNYSRAGLSPAESQRLARQWTNLRLEVLDCWTFKEIEHHLWIGFKRVSQKFYGIG